jgi:ADP-ribose pyrophosphatase YjhB (NUDIX family)
MQQAQHPEKRFVIRSRAVIMHEDKLLLVRHPHRPESLVLPGGHLEWGEDPRECLRRELVEELGIEPILGRLLYVNTFMDGNKQLFEFFIEVTNGKEYRDADAYIGIMTKELAEVLWVTHDVDVRILPLGFAKDFREGKLIRDETRFIDG